MANPGENGHRVEENVSDAPFPSSAGLNMKIIHLAKSWLLNLSNLEDGYETATISCRCDGKIAGIAVSAEAVGQRKRKQRCLSLENSDKSDLHFIWVSSFGIKLDYCDLFVKMSHPNRGTTLKVGIFRIFQLFRFNSVLEPFFCTRFVRRRGLLPLPHVSRRS